jgi:hypothetical protein
LFLVITHLGVLGAVTTIPGIPWMQKMTPIFSPRQYDWTFQLMTEQWNFTHKTIFNLIV